MLPFSLSLGSNCGMHGRSLTVFFSLLKAVTVPANVYMMHQIQEEKLGHVTQKDSGIGVNQCLITNLKVICMLYEDSLLSWKGP